MQAIVTGTKRAYTNQKLPFMSITLPRVDAHYLGSLLQMHLLEMIYLGQLLNVNPFDQPHVELYKSETRKILAHGK